MKMLEWLRKCAGCRFISDLRYGANNESAKTAAKDIDFSRYTIHEISDAISYLYGSDNKFDTIEDVKLFLDAQQKSKKKFLKALFHQL